MHRINSYQLPNVQFSTLLYPLICGSTYRHIRNCWISRSMRPTFYAISWGHSERTHKKHYRTLAVVFNLRKAGKFLLMMEKDGIQKYHGKSLHEMEKIDDETEAMFNQNSIVQKNQILATFWLKIPKMEG